MHRLIAITAIVIAALPVHGQAIRRGAPFVVPQWAFPTQVNAPPAPPFDSVLPLHVAGSSRSFTMAQAQDGFAAPDWFPELHPVMPRAVSNGQAPVWRACGFCHLPNGNGRPENATLAGLPVAYIRSQIAAFRDHSRLVANPLSNVTSMHQIAAAVPDTDLLAAARYFSALKLVRPNRVLEVDSAPRTHVEGIILSRDEPSGGAENEPIAGRLLEVPADFVLHEMHDPTVVYTTYVPRGSLARGAQLAAKGSAGPLTACVTCHGPELRGVGVIPPIAGRSPSYILRQLINFRSGARHDTGSAPMRRVVSRLGLAEMVSLAAYVGSRPALSLMERRKMDTIPAHDAFAIPSTILGESRPVNVYVPPMYAGSTNRFPVLYMPDGGIDEDFPHVVREVQALVAAHVIRPVIVVGVPNTERRRDLTGPTRVGSDSEIAPHVGGSAAFRQFIATELIPEIDRRYRTTNERSIIGESLAGLFIMETFMEQPSLFTHYVSLDPSLWWNNGALVAVAESRITQLDHAPRSLFFATSHEPSTAVGAARIAGLLKARAPAELRWTYVPRRDLEHSNIFLRMQRQALASALR